MKLIKIFDTLNNVIIAFDNNMKEANTACCWYNEHAGYERFIVIKGD